MQTTFGEVLATLFPSLIFGFGKLLKPKSLLSYVLKLHVSRLYPIMALPKCAACGHGTFELRETKVNRVATAVLAGSPVPVLMVQCASCGAVVGALDPGVVEMFATNHRRPSAGTSA